MDTNIKLKENETLIIETPIEWLKLVLDGEGSGTLEHLEYKITNDTQP
jgi:hypothetical protein